VVLVKCQYAMEGGLSSIVNIDCIKLSISSIYDHDTPTEEGEMEIGDKKPKNITLLDVQFVDNEALILLVQNEGKLYHTPFSPLYPVSLISSVYCIIMNIGILNIVFFYRRPNHKPPHNPLLNTHILHPFIEILPP